MGPQKELIPRHLRAKKKKYRSQRGRVDWGQSDSKKS